MKNKLRQSVASPSRVQMAYTVRQNKLPQLELDYTIILLGKEVTYTWGLDVQELYFME